MKESPSIFGVIEYIYVMDERTLQINKLAMQLQAVVELDNSLGVSYCNIPLGLKELDLSSHSAQNIDNPIQTNSDIDAGDKAELVREKSITAQTTRNFQTTHIPNKSGKLSSVIITGDKDKIREIESINNKVVSCTDCVLAQSRKTPVRSEGYTDADIAFVASAPGREEDNFGRNFQGAAGQLIIDIIEKGMNIPSEKVYFTSIVKCRPPGNRDLLDIEIESCIRYFEEEMRIVSPKIIIAVGGAATNILTSQNVSIEMTRGVWYHYNGIPLMPIYHPSFLLRQRRKLGHTNEFVRKTWQDIKQVIARLKR